MATIPTTVSIPTGDFVTSSLVGSITSSSTSFTIGGGLNLAPANGILELDYDSLISLGSDGGPETILYAGYNSATGAVNGVTRAINNTIAVAHSNSATVQAGMSIAYLNNISDIAANSPWTTYTPVWTASVNPVLGNGTLVGKYFQIGKLVWFRIRLVSGSTTTYGTSDYRFSLQVTANAGYLGQDIVGSAHFADTGTNLYDGNAYWVTSNTIEGRVFTSGAGYSKQVSSTHPIAGASGQTIMLVGCYEAA